ncbi:ATP-dependent helicase [Candidatus Magnetaquicoccus inordinatus]|uniref:ATP-dependent helicase n=1 Tax=Candidatus Magnetaquicoccus inordinatus TaxID=2496818 RepID=UPI00102CCC66|nr:UvrD-helicase domain-containing protein [Candidatus Magnetaquicoccus inordinatus]
MDLLNDLNEPQRQAVEAQQGAVMVLAGAGSGKTRVLTRRLAYLLRNGAVAPERILAVTFTNKAAREMRDRVIELVQGDGIDVRRMWIGTFHGMGARMLRQHADSLQYQADFLILASDEQLHVVKKLVTHLQFEDLFWTPKRLANTFSRWKDDGLTAEQIGSQQIKRDAERARVVAVYVAYQEELRRLNAMDFGDLLANCLQLWRENPEILLSYQRRFQYILVDEYQDTNAIQYEWIKCLAAHHGNVCVVGDDDQSIYSWRGARLDNILRFKEDFPVMQLVRLEQNYRSTGNILRAASQLIDHNQGRMGKTLWTSGAEGARLQYYAAEDGEDEARFVAAETARLCRDGSYGRVAVLVRTSHQTRLLEEAMNRQMVAYRIVGGLRFMDRAEVRDAVAYLRLVYMSRDDLAFERVINVPSRKLGPAALRVIQEQAQLAALTLLEGARQVVEKGLLATGARKSLAEFLAVIDAGRELAVTTSADQVLQQVLQNSGYLASLQVDDREGDRRDNLQELQTLLAQTSDLGTFLEQAALDADPPRAHAEEETQQRVIISTLHAAKGLEFPVVFLVGMEEGLLPHKLAMEEGGLEEERRLLYVGMTRAQERLYLSHARRRMWMNRGEPAMPSRFLKEVPPEVLEKRGGQQLTVRKPFSGWARR